MPWTDDFRCPECGFEGEYLSMTKEIREAAIGGALKCECGAVVKRVFINAPSFNKIGKDGTDSAIKAMKESFRDRFKKYEIDDIRHKHGRAFDESLVAGAANRIRKGKMEIDD